MFKNRKLSTNSIVGIMCVVGILGTLLLGIFSGPVTDQGLFQADESFAMGDWDLRVNKQLAAGTSNVFVGDTITYEAEIENVDLGGAVVATNVTIRDTLPAGMTYDGTFSSSIPGAITFVSYDAATGVIEWNLGVLFDGESVVLSYDVNVTTTGLKRNKVEVIPDSGAVVESVPYISGSCTNSGNVNPLNDGEESVPGTNNVDCELLGVSSGSVDGQCGADNGGSFYLPAQPQSALCNTGLPDVPALNNHVWTWNCIGESGGAVVACSATELYCGDTVFQPEFGEACEDGNAVDGDGCTALCEIEGCTRADAYNRTPDATIDNGTCRYCGDGLFELSEGEFCDDGESNNTGVCTPGYEATCTACSSSCETVDFFGGECGDGIIQGPEVCDDNNTVDGDGCSSTCLNIEAGWTCPIEGTSCVDDNECVLGTDTCSDDATCTNTPGAFSCACNTGFAGDGETCLDINECLAGTDTCSDDATCTNTPGSFSCSCDAGYTGDGETCNDLDECVLGTDTCSDDATCTNTPGGFSCSCDAGFAGDGETCLDINECLNGTNTCSDDATCTNMPGTFSCACDAGYTGDGETCNDVDECVLGTDTCSDDATCTNTLGSFSCSCDAGFAGDGISCVEVCGDGIVTASEACDDSNTVGGDGCSSSCAWETVSCTLNSFAPLSGLLPHEITGTIGTQPWAVVSSVDRGNGTVENSSSLERSYTYFSTGQYDITVTVAHRDNGAITDTCSIAVQAATICGNESVEFGEGCDEGALNGIACVPGYGTTCSYCNAGCELEEVVGANCGDGIIQENEGEVCDQGVLENNSSCEAPYEGTCTGCTASCQESEEVFGGECGDGIKQGPEECDDGNSIAGDSCSNECEVINQVGGASSSITAGNFIIPKSRPERLVVKEHTAAPVKVEKKIVEIKEADTKKESQRYRPEPYVFGTVPTPVTIENEKPILPKIVVVPKIRKVAQPSKQEHSVAITGEVSPVETPVNAALREAQKVEDTPKYEVTETTPEEIMAALLKLRERQ